MRIHSILTIKIHRKKLQSVVTQLSPFTTPEYPGAFQAAFTIETTLHHVYPGYPWFTPGHFVIVTFDGVGDKYTRVQWLVTYHRDGTLWPYYFSRHWWSGQKKIGLFQGWTLGKNQFKSSFFLGWVSGKIHFLQKKI